MLFPYKPSNLDADLKAVSICGFLLKTVHIQTEAICLAAVEQNGIALQWVHIQTPRICISAVRRDIAALQYIHTKELYDHVVSTLKLI